MFGLLRVIAGPDQGMIFTVAEGEPLVIGRSPASKAQLRDPQVAEVHCQVQLQGNCVLLSDCASAKGTWVNGKQITRGQLHPGDVIRIGYTQLSFEWCHADEQSTKITSG
jgi:pSer/pThr/pTyr-binding forkhead associated (FHA) protein